MGTKAFIKNNINYLILFSMMAFSLLGDSMLYVVLPTQIEALSLTASNVGILLGANRIIRFGSNFWAIRIFNRYGNEKPFIFAIVLGSSVTIFYGLNHSFWYLLFLRIIWGISYSLTRLKVLAAIFEKSRFNDENEIRNEGRLSGFYRSISRVGIFTGMILGGYLADKFNFFTTTIILGVISLVGVISLLFIYIKLFSISFSEANGLKLSESYVEKKYSSTKKGLNLLFFKKIIKDKSFMILMFTAFSLYFAISGILNSSYSLYLTQLFGDNISFVYFVLGTTTVSGIILSTQNLTDVLFSPFLGYLTDYFNTSKLLSITLLINSLIFFMLSAFTSKPFIIILPVLCFIFNSFTVLLLYVIINKHKTYETKNKIASLITAGDIGAAIGPLTLGIIELGYNISMLYYICSFLFLFSLIIYIINK